MRIWAMVNHIVVWISAIIVTGVISWMIKVHNQSSWSDHRTKILYEEIIVRCALRQASKLLPSRGRLN